MNGLLKKIFSLLILFGINLPSYGQIDKVITYNIKYDNPKDSLNNWNNRKQELVSLFHYYAPDIIGIQEGLNHQLKYIDSHLVDYSRIGVGRDDGKQEGEFSPIYYDHNKFSVIDESTFWLSDQDDIVSVGWDASMERICTYGIFENKVNQEKILVLNTHFDHRGPKARAESSKLILSKIKTLNKDNYPVILMGDLNAEPETKAITILKEKLTDGAELSKDGIYGPEGTFTGFTKAAIADRRIDYIFVKNLQVRSYRHIDDKMKNGNYLSDHLPVFVEFN